MSLALFGFEEIGSKAASLAGSERNLDKLAQLSPTLQGNDRRSLQFRAKARRISYALAKNLTQLKKSVLAYSYTSTLHCCSALTHIDGKLVGKYCNQRWCLVCNRIRIAKCINGYTPELSAFLDPHFVTLTIPNCSDLLLAGWIRWMRDRWRIIYKAMKKAGFDVRGIWKLECTYNRRKRNFHPHFHMIVEGKNVADFILAKWMEAVPGASLKGQDVKPCTPGSMKELFKYFTKVVTYPTNMPDGEERKKAGRIYINALDVIFCAMRGLRVFQPFGIKKNVSEDIEQLTAIEANGDLQTQLQSVDEMRAEMIADGTALADEINQQTVYFWHQDSGDWIELNTGACLSGFDSPKWLIEINKIIVFDHW